MGDLSIQRGFLEKWMASVDRQVAEAAASPPTRPLEHDTANGDIRAAIGTLSERSHQTEAKIDRLTSSVVLLQQGMTNLLVTLSAAASTDNQTEQRLQRLDADAQERDKRLNKLEGWRYGVRMSTAALMAVAGVISALITWGLEFLRR